MLEVMTTFTSRHAPCLDRQSPCGVPLPRTADTDTAASDSRERVDKSQVNLGGRFSSKLRSVWRGQSPFVPEGEGGSKEFQGQPGQQQHRRRRLGDGRGAGWIGGGGVAEREARGEEEGSGTVREAERGRAKAKEVEGYNLTGGGREAEGGGGGEGNVCLDSGSVVGRVSRSGGCGRSR
ncbi:unnamed protein product [Lampetra planeri]